MLPSVLRRLAGLAIIAGALLSGPAAQAQRNFYRVYQYEAPLKGWLEATLWTTAVPRSTFPYEHFGASPSRQGLKANSIELEYGLTDKVSLGVYADAEAAAESPLRFTQSRFVLRYRLAQRYEHFFNTGLYFEYDTPRRSYGGQDVEMRVILDHDFNDFRLALNPTLSKSVTGEESLYWPHAILDAGLYYRRLFAVQPGVELYSDFGEIGPFRGQSRILFPTVDLRFGNFDWNLGAGLPLTASADRFTLKSILTFQFGAVRPELLFHRGQRPTTNK